MLGNAQNTGDSCFAAGNAATVGHDPRHEAAIDEDRAIAELERREDEIAEPVLRLRALLIRRRNQHLDRLAILERAGGLDPGKFSRLLIRIRLRRFVRDGGLGQRLLEARDEIVLPVAALELPDAKRDQDAERGERANGKNDPASPRGCRGRSDVGATWLIGCGLPEPCSRIEGRSSWP